MPSQASFFLPQPTATIRPFFKVIALRARETGAVFSSACAPRGTRSHSRFSRFSMGREGDDVSVDGGLSGVSVSSSEEQLLKAVRMHKRRQIHMLRRAGYFEWFFC